MKKKTLMENGSRLNPIEIVSYKIEEGEDEDMRDQNYPNLMKIGINLQDDRISCEVIHESMNSVSYEKFFFLSVKLLWHEN